MKTLLFSLMFAALCNAQATGGIHSAVSRSVDLPADEASFNVTVTAKLDSTAKQVKEALQNAGAPNPTVVATSVGATGRLPAVADGPQLVYSATFTLPAASAPEVAKRLLNLSTHLTDPLTSVQLSLNYAASEAKVELVRQSLLPQMRDEAQRNAQAMAAAAGVKLGPIRAVNDSAGGVYLAARVGNFSSSTTITGILSSIPANIAYTIRLELVFDTLP